MQLKASSLEETAQIARLVATQLVDTPCLLLRGGLGAGKTTFSKFILHHLLGIEIDEVVSPTYSYVHLYQDKVAHFDLYRIQDPIEIEELGLEELLTNPSFIKIIEWPDVALSLLPLNRIEITIDTLDSADRLFSVHEATIASKGCDKNEKN